MQLVMQQVTEGVVVAESAGPFQNLKVFRLQRHVWKYAPDEPGVYFLIGEGSGSGKARIYVGQSESKKAGIRERLRKHKRTPNKAFFGEIFAFPFSDPVFCKAVEAEFIKELQEAEDEGVLELANDNPEENSLGGFPAAVKAAQEDIRIALAILLGKDVFVDQGATAAEVSDSPTAYNSTLNSLIDAGLIHRSETLVAKGSDAQASINEDGSLSFDGDDYSSLSKAGSAARVKAGGHPSVNGWAFWHVKRDDELVPLGDLRKQSESSA